MPTIKEMILSEDYADYILPIYPQFWKATGNLGPSFSTTIME